MNLGSFFFSEIMRMTSSLRPRGTVSASISVTNPCLYSRLASSAIVLVAVGIKSPEIPKIQEPNSKNPRPWFLSSILQYRGEGNQVEGRRQGGLSQAGTDQVDHSAFVLQKVGQGDSIQ